MKPYHFYQKLVRDRISEQIRSTGFTPQTRILSDDEYIQALEQKLDEECLELKQAETRPAMAEEIADVLEVLEAIAAYYDIRESEIRQVKQNKQQKNGAFRRRILLISTTQIDKSCE